MRKYIIFICVLIMVMTFGFATPVFAAPSIDIVYNSSNVATLHCNVRNAPGYRFMRMAVWSEKNDGFRAFGKPK